MRFLGGMLQPGDFPFGFDRSLKPVRGSGFRIWARILLGVWILGFVLMDAAPAQTGWRLVWSDEFNGPAGAPPDPSNWKFEAGPGSIVAGNQEAETYCAYGSGDAPCQQNVPNAYQDGRGHLVIVAVRTDKTISIPGKSSVSPVYTSARLDSLKSFQYGRIEASIRVPTGAGVWPAFWALGGHGQSLNWPETGEMDIMESWNPQPGTSTIDPLLNHASVHGPIEPGSKKGYIDVTGTYSFAQPMQQAFHQFAAEWGPGEVDFYCDGNLYSRQSVGSLSAREVWELDNAPFYLLLNLAMGGGFFGYPDATTGPTPTMVVDYVRVYQRDDSVLPNGWGNADIGGPAQAGFSSNPKGLWTVAGGGAGIAGRTDQFQFAYKALGGDGEISARVVGQSSKIAQAKAGVMIRNGRGSGTLYAMMFISPDGSIHFRARGDENEVPGETLYKGTANWFKVGRNGEIFTGYVSNDGATWKAVGQAKLAMRRDVLAGLISTSRDNGAPNIAQFDHVEVTPSDAAWDGAAATLPGVVQAEDFDTGVDGYSYTASMKHKGVSPFRPNDGPAIKQIQTHGEPDVVPGGYYLSDLPANVYLNYSVTVTTEGNYAFHVRVASAGAGGSIHFNVDQKPVTKPIRIPDTGGPETWRDVASESVRLPAGQHIIAIVVDSAGTRGSAGNIDFFAVREQ
ncbi:MAG: family 16 glycosylhydrolase [Terracidiphilus sp.]